MVIGIIALLISVLLPALSKARDAANRAKCLSNLHQIGLAMIMYCGDNKGYFTAGARFTTQNPSDFIYWQQPAGYWDNTVYNYGVFNNNHRYLDNGPLVKYMGQHFNANNWLCPSDNQVRFHGTYDPTGTYPAGQWPSAYPQYPYSYSMNIMLVNDLVEAGQTVELAWMGGQTAKLASVRHTSTTVIMMEESFQSLDDGFMSVVGMSLGATGGTNGNDISQVYPGGSGANWLSVVHDRTAQYPDQNPPNVSNLNGFIPNANCKGNAVFCDGHAEYVTRAYVQTPVLRHWDPSF